MSQVPRWRAAWFFQLSKPVQRLLDGLVHCCRRWVCGRAANSAPGLGVRICRPPE
jgi:hypothetical protein